jgi:hypothetical protein
MNGALQFRYKSVVALAQIAGAAWAFPRVGRGVLRRVPALVNGITEGVGCGRAW